MESRHFDVSIRIELTIIFHWKGKCALELDTLFLLICYGLTIGTRLK